MSENQAQPFCYLFRVRYGECDAQQVVFNARYGEYVDLAVNEFLRQLFGGYQNLVQQGVETQVVRLLTEWQGPARFDDVLCARVYCNKLGNTSLQLAVDLTQHPSGQAVATSEVTYVVVDAQQFTKVPIPNFMRTQLELGAPGVVVNHAGVIA